MAQVRLFFIVGVAKSGTTWLQLTLDAHPRISCHGEGHFTDNLLPLLEKAAAEYKGIISERNRRMYGAARGFPVLEHDDMRQLLCCAIALLLSKQRGLKEVDCIGEKTPGHIRFMPLLAELFPTARFLHIIRDGRDVAVSGWLHNVRTDEQQLRRIHGDFSRYALHVAQVWQAQIAAARTFSATHADRYFELRYEDLHDEPERWIERVLRFLDVDPAPELCRQCREAGEFERLSRGRQRGQEDRGSHFRKGVVGDWQQHFTPELHAAFLERAGSCLRQFGYELGSAPSRDLEASMGTERSAGGATVEPPSSTARPPAAHGAAEAPAVPVTDTEFARAVALHQAGRLADADAIYRAILERDPRHSDSLHLLGVIAHQTGRHHDAIQSIRQAIVLCGHRASYYSNLGIALRALGQLDEAATQLRRAVAIDPHYIAAHKNLAVTLKESGAHGEAAEHFRRALKLNPRDAGAAISLGALLQSQGKLEDAAQAFRQALEAAPGNPDALNNLGVVLKDLRRLEESLELLRQAVAQRPDFALGLNNLAVTLRELGQLDESFDLLQQALNRDPQSTVIRSNWAVALKTAGRLDDAAAELRLCLTQDPNYVPAHNNLGETLKELGRFHEAIHHLLRAIELDPRCAEAHNNLGLTHKELGEHESAAKHYRRSLEINPRYVPALTNLGNSLVAAGELDLGTQQFERAVEIDPRCVAAYYALAVHSRHSFNDRELDHLHTLLQRRSLSPADRSLLCFALAMVLDKTGRHDDAFQHARQANELRSQQNRRMGTQFDPQRHRRLVDALTATFSRELFDSTCHRPTPDPLPIFVVGMPRSSTTLVEQILASHPLVHGAGELPDIERLVAELPARLGTPEPYPACVTYLAPETARPMADAYLKRLRSLGGNATRVIDKMTVNFLHLGLIALLFPGARVIHCTRDPRDTCLSCYMHNFASHGLNFTFDLEHLAEFYLQYERLMRHWAALLPLPILDVAYETLVRDQEATSRGMVEFCGLEWHPRCLAFHENTRAVKTASFLQVREPIYTRSIGRWKNYASQLDPLLRRLEPVLAATVANPAVGS